MSLLYERYKKEAIPKLKKEFGVTNDLAVPRVMRIVVNSGIGRLAQAAGDTAKKRVEEITKEIAELTGQKPVIRQARKSIAGFKLRKGDPAGVAVTLRGGRMWDFLDRMIFFALPRMRDFRGIAPKAIDQNGSLNIGFREQLVFPEISSEELHTPFGFEVTIVTNAKTKERGEKLFRALGFPLKK